jgi:hypothetical protein
MSRPKGWHSRGYLPHFDSPEAVQFITFRLADSLPAVIEDLRRDDNILQRLDQELDTGLGTCWLRQPEIASLIEGALLLPRSGPTQSSAARVPFGMPTTSIAICETKTIWPAR